MNLDALHQVALAMTAPGRGILAADESTGTIKKRFDSIGVENTEENRRDYREMMFGATPAMAAMSGVILYDETIWQNGADGTSFVDMLNAVGALPGIKVDRGAGELPGFPGEVIIEGLDGLSARLIKYYERGARFAKWRAVIDIAEGIPSAGAIKANAHALARYAALCQEHQIVPIVEPEVLMDGAHDIDRCDEVTRFTLQTVFQELFEQRVKLEGMVLKPNMIIAGRKSPVQASVEQVARRTIAALKATTPSAVPGIAYLSGGQSDVEATAHLDAMVRLGGFPWNMTFSYGRALQAAGLKAWGGHRENLAAARAAFAHRARMNSLASLGQWSEALEAA